MLDEERLALTEIFNSLETLDHRKLFTEVEAVEYSTVEFSLMDMLTTTNS